MQTFLKTNERLRLSNRASFDRLLEQRFSSLKESYPTLYKQASEPMSEDASSILYQLLFQAQRVKNNEVTEHDASVSVGKLLVDKYIVPVVPDSARNS